MYSIEKMRQHAPILNTTVALGHELIEEMRRVAPSKTVAIIHRRKFTPFILFAVNGLLQTSYQVLFTLQSSLLRLRW